MTQQQLTSNWIDKQLELCENIVSGPWHTRRDSSTQFVQDKEGYIVAKFLLPSDAKFIAAASYGYPLVLQKLQQAQNELRLVFSILQGLSMSIDELFYENIKTCIASLVCAGSDWLERQRDGNTKVQEES